MARTRKIVEAPTPTEAELETLQTIDEALKASDQLIGQEWEKTGKKIIAILSETDTYYLVQIEDGSTYHYGK